MPDPREEAVAKAIVDYLGKKWTFAAYGLVPVVLAAADAVDPMRRRKSGSHRLTDPAELRARLADVEHDAATSAAAVARLYELLADAVVRAETAEADRDTLTEALEELHQAGEPYVDLAFPGEQMNSEALRQYHRWHDAMAKSDAALAAVKGRDARADAGFRDRHGRAIDSSQGGPVEGREDA